MIKLYDPDEKKRTDLRIDIEQGKDCVDLNIVDIEGNLVCSILKISKDGVLLHKDIDICFDNINDIPFKINNNGYIKITKE